MFGLTLVNKPQGLSSRQAVDSVKKLIRPCKVGHSGTLDPLARGLLVICLGPATRLVRFVHQLPKTYLAEFQLGVASPSDDTETELVSVPYMQSIDPELLRAVIGQFVGEILQTPPAYSAIKVAGRRAYQLSRKGHTVKLQPRKTTVYAIELIDFDLPRFTLRIVCGSGTYIRALGRDIGHRLQTSAIMTQLTRLQIGPFTLEQALAIDTITIDKLKRYLIPPTSLFAPSSLVTMTPEESGRLRNGLFVSREAFSATTLDRLIAVDENGNLLTVLTRHNQHTFKPSINFSHQ